MFFHHDPDEWETVSTSRRCGFHEFNPGGFHPGCTCSCTIGTRRRPQHEIDRIKADKQRKREDAILREADVIRARRQFAEYAA